MTDLQCFVENFEIFQNIVGISDEQLTQNILIDGNGRKFSDIGRIRKGDFRYAKPIGKYLFRFVECYGGSWDIKRILFIMMDALVYNRDEYTDAEREVIRNASRKLGEGLKVSRDIPVIRQLCSDWRWDVGSNAAVRNPSVLDYARMMCGHDEIGTFDMIQDLVVKRRMSRLLCVKRSVNSARTSGEHSGRTKAAKAKH